MSAKTKQFSIQIDGKSAEALHRFCNREAAVEAEHKENAAACQEKRKKRRHMHRRRLAQVKGIGWAMLAGWAESLVVCWSNHAMHVCSTQCICQLAAM